MGMGLELKQKTPLIRFHALGRWDLVRFGLDWAGLGWARLGWAMPPLPLHNPFEMIHYEFVRNICNLVDFKKIF